MDIFLFDENIHFYFLMYFYSNKYIMAEGGGDFENPTFDEDDYVHDIDDRLPMVPGEIDQRIRSKQSGGN